MLVIQSVKNAPEFNGRLELTMTGTLGGKPWTKELPGGAQALQLRQYRRVEGVVDLPAGVVVKTVSARLIDGSTTKAVQTIKI